MHRSAGISTLDPSSKMLLLTVLRPCNKGFITDPHEYRFGVALVMLERVSDKFLQENS